MTTRPAHLDGPHGMNTPTPPAGPNWFERMRTGQVPRAPVADLLDSRVRRVDLDRGLLEVDYQAVPGFANPAGSVQGGMLGAMLDDLCAGLVDATLRPGEIVATLNLNLSFLRAARVGPLSGQATLQRRGREVCHVAAELRQDDQTVATAVATCLVVVPKPQVPPRA